MSSHRGVLDLPKRLSLSSQAADALRKAIAGNAWPEFLPSERRLCQLLQVSRPTVRTALGLLAQEGLIEIHHGRRHQLLTRPAAPATHTVRFADHIALEQASLASVEERGFWRDLLAEFDRVELPAEGIAC